MHHSVIFKITDPYLREIKKLFTNLKINNYAIIGVVRIIIIFTPNGDIFTL